MTNSKTHIFQHDFRADSLNQIIEGLNKSIDVLRKRNKEIGWYDGLWLMEDAEPILGLALIAFQNYIVGSIKDLYETTTNKNLLYKLDPRVENFENSSAELIIALANYAKHKDEGEPHKHTKAMLENFNLTDFNEITNSPIFDGLELLDKDLNLFKILDIVICWRKNLFEHYIKHSL